MDNLEEPNRKRFRFLYRLYEKTNGDMDAIVNMYEIGQELGFGGFGSEETKKIVQWLEGELLIKTKYLGGVIGITHDGIKEVEEARFSPTNPTEHFQAHSINVVYNYGAITNSNIQQGSSRSSQNITITIQQRQAVREILTAIRDLLKSDHNLSPKQVEQLKKEVDVSDSEAKANKPKIQRLKESLTSIKNIIEGAAVGTAIVPKIVSFLSG